MWWPAGYHQPTIKRSFEEKQTTKTTFKVFEQCFQHMCVQEVLISCVWAILSDDIEANDSFG